MHEIHTELNKRHLAAHAKDSTISTSTGDTTELEERYKNAMNESSIVGRLFRDKRGNPLENLAYTVFMHSGNQEQFYVPNESQRDPLLE